MKIAIIGGGPAGLYAAILLKKQRPQAEITVYERNRADDTFGFGVVFSDATLDNFEKYDAPSYRRITQEFAYWDDIAVHFRGTVHRVGGNGFCGCSRRMLLLILQERARELGVALIFEADIEDEARFADADLVILADGINLGLNRMADAIRGVTYWQLALVHDWHIREESYRAALARLATRSRSTKWSGLRFEGV